MDALNRLTVLGNALTQSSLNPLTQEPFLWANVWNACKRTLLMDPVCPPERLALMLSTPVCVTSEIAVPRWDQITLWIPQQEFATTHPLQWCEMVGDIYTHTLSGQYTLPTELEQSLLSAPQYNVWRDGGLGSAYLNNWKSWVNASCRHEPVGPWGEALPTASRFRPTLFNSLVEGSKVLRHLQVGGNLNEVLEQMVGRDLNAEEMFVVKTLCDICLPSSTLEREEVLKQLTVEWADRYNDGPEVDQMINLVTSVFRPSQWQEDFDVKWARVVRGWESQSHPLETSQVLDLLASCYSAASSPIGKWVEAYIHAHGATQTPLSDCAATHVWLARPDLLEAAFPCLSSTQKTNLRAAAHTGLFPQLEEAFNSLHGPNVVTFPSKGVFSGL